MATNKIMVHRAVLVIV